MSRLERLINLVAALLDTTVPLAASELRRRVPGYSADKLAFRRAFERDKDTLREMGIPISVEPVPGTSPPVEGYRIPHEDYYLPDPDLAEDELAALHLAAMAVHVEGANGMAALWKLGGAVAEGGPPPATAALPGASHLGELFGAVSQRRRIEFRYRGQLRTVDGHRLSFRNGHWYLAATDVVKDAQRWFRLDRVDAVVALGDPHSAVSSPGDATAPPPPWAIGDGQPLTARLRVDQGQAGWATSHLGGGAEVGRGEDGSYIFEFQVTNRPAFRSFVLGFLDHATVLGPDELVDDVVSWLRELAARGAQQQVHASESVGADPSR